MHWVYVLVITKIEGDLHRARGEELHCFETRVRGSVREQRVAEPWGSGQGIFR